MIIEKYNPNSLSVSAILGLIASGDIAIPEIQRPFVWKKTQVRDLLDSLYKGYPTGYLIIWKNHNVKLKDGSVSAGKKILIDGQQRITTCFLILMCLYNYYHNSPLEQSTILNLMQLNGKFVLHNDTIVSIDFNIKIPPF